MGRSNLVNIFDLRIWKKSMCKINAVANTEMKTPHLV